MLYDFCVRESLIVKSACMYVYITVYVYMYGCMTLFGATNQYKLLLFMKTSMLSTSSFHHMVIVWY